MYIYGHFYNRQDERVEVHIVTQGDRGKRVEIGTGGGVDWTADPVEIEGQVNDTFDVVLGHQATVRLMVKNYMPELFCASCRDAIVNIYRDGECLFSGFVEPQCYSQGYIDEQDEVELSCIDVLTALRYFKYRNVGAKGAPSYEAMRATAGTRTLGALVCEMLDGMTAGLDLTGGHAVRYLHDGSKSTSEGGSSALESVAVSELLFLGNEPGEVWEQEAVMAEVLKYLNLHVVQVGFDFYFYDWASVKRGAPIKWQNLKGGATETMARRVTTIVPGNVADADTTITVGQIYNQLQLTCKVEGVDALVESPLDSKLIEPAFAGKQKYMVEYSAEGKGRLAQAALKAMLTGGTSDYDRASVTTWYLCLKDNKNWTFGAKGADLVAQYTADDTHQERLPNYLRTTPGCALLSLGKVEMTMSREDNSPAAKVDMRDYLVMSVNGNGNDTEAGTYPQPADILASVPQAVYTGSTSGGVFSPADNESVNYIVFSGKIALNPVMELTAPFEVLKEVAEKGTDMAWWIATGKTVPCRNNSDGRLYTQEFYKATTPTTKAESDPKTSGLVPFTESGPQEYEFTYSAIGEGGDTISKVAVVACMLVIGNKCLVETGKDGQVCDFKWVPYKRREACTSDDEYYSQSFTLGFTPKKGDKLIGTSYPIQNNLDYTMGLEVEGTAIPIRRQDKLSGAVQFAILGPVNTMWDEITRRHPTWFRRTKWTKTSIPLLAHVSSIFLEQFEVKVYSDNVLTSAGSDHDLVYLSDTQEHFVNTKDDIEFKITSALTSAECRQLGVAGGVKMSTPLNMGTGEGLLTIHDNVQGVAAKAEQLYVDSYYWEWHAPRLLMNQAMMDTHEAVSRFGLYKHPSLSEKTFFVQNMSRNLQEGVAELTLKEIEK